MNTKTFLLTAAASFVAAAVFAGIMYAVQSAKAKKSQEVIEAA